MKKLEKLSFENIRVMEDEEFVYNGHHHIHVYDDDANFLSGARCTQMLINDLPCKWFYTEILDPEINYFFLEVFSDEERTLTDSMSLDKYVSYVNDTYGEYEASTLNELYEKYINLKEFISENTVDPYSTCIYINNIESNSNNTGSGTLIVDYLKSKYDFICLYSTSEAENYWLDKADFKEIINGFMYWTKNKKLNDILK